MGLEFGAAGFVLNDVDDIEKSKYNEPVAKHLDHGALHTLDT